MKKKKLTKEQKRSAVSCAEILLESWQEQEEQHLLFMEVAEENNREAYRKIEGITDKEIETIFRAFKNHLKRIRWNITRAKNIIAENSK